MNCSTPAGAKKENTLESKKELRLMVENFGHCYINSFTSQSRFDKDLKSTNAMRKFGGPAYLHSFLTLLPHCMVM